MDQASKLPRRLIRIGEAMAKGWMNDDNVGVGEHAWHLQALLGGERA